MHKNSADMPIAIKTNPGMVALRATKITPTLRQRNARVAVGPPQHLLDSNRLYHIGLSLSISFRSSQCLI
jgi:hypothetical protein